MKVAAIGDVHGKVVWKEIVRSVDEFDKILFIGDYLDSFDYDVSHMLKNFEEILEFKRNYPDKVVLLYGNHCHHYSGLSSQQYSGFRNEMYTRANELFKEAIAKNEIVASFHADGVLYSHAGVTKTWLKNSMDSFNSGEDVELLEGLEVSLFLNDCLKYRSTLFDYSHKGLYPNPYGDDVFQTPIWVRPRSLMEDRIDCSIQVVGHTRHDEITYHVDERTCFIDCLDEKFEYACVDNGKITSKSLYEK